MRGFISFGLKIFSSPKASKPAVRPILASSAVGPNILSPGVNSREVKLATDFHLPLRSGVPVPQLPLFTFMAWRGATFNFLVRG